MTAPLHQLGFTTTREAENQPGPLSPSMSAAAVSSMLGRHTNLTGQDPYAHVVNTSSRSPVPPQHSTFAGAKASEAAASSSKPRDMSSISYYKDTTIEDVTEDSADLCNKAPNGMAAASKPTASARTTPATPVSTQVHTPAATTVLAAAAAAAVAAAGKAITITHTLASKVLAGAATAFARATQIRMTLADSGKVPSLVDRLTSMPDDVLLKICCAATQAELCREVMQSSHLLLESKCPSDSECVSLLRLLSKLLSVVGDSFRTHLQFESGTWAQHKLYARKIQLQCVCIKVLITANPGAVLSCMDDLHILQPLLTLFCLTCDAASSPCVRMGIPLGPRLQRFEHLKSLIIHNVDIGTPYTTAIMDRTTWSYVFVKLPALQALDLQGISPSICLNDLKECPHLQAFKVSGANILQFNILDLTSCPDLRYLVCSNSTLTSLIVSGSPLLATLLCSDNKLSVLNLSMCTALAQLDCSGNNLTKLDVSLCPALTHLKCSNNLLTDLNLSTNFLLEVMDCSLNQIMELDLDMCECLTKATYLHSRGYTPLISLSRCTKLQALNIKHARLDAGGLPVCENLTSLLLHDVSNTLSLKLQNFPRLERLKLFGTGPNVLDVSVCTHLTHLECYRIYFMTKVLAVGCTELQFLSVQDCPLHELDVSGCTGLLTLKCLHAFYVSSVDLSTCVSLREGWFQGGQITNLDMTCCASTLVKLFCSEVTTLRSLSVNGCSKLVEFDCSGCGSLEEVNCGGCSSLDLQALPFQGAGKFRNLTVGEVLALEV